MGSTTSDDATVRRRKIKVGLAALAVLGVGAAATSAAWTDDVWFDATLVTQRFDLTGNVTADTVTTPPGTGWQDSPTSDAITLHIPVTTLEPGVPQTYHLWIRNDGDLTADLDDSPVVSAVSDDSGPAISSYVTTTLGAWSSTTDRDALAPDGTVYIPLTIELDAATPASVSGGTASFTVHFHGESV